MEMPPEPLSDMHLAAVGISEMYRSLRAGGMGILAAAAFCAASVLYGEPPPPG